MPSAGSPAATFAAAPVGDAPPPAVAGRGPRYRRRRPEETTLHALLRAHAAAFFARAEAGGARVPGFVRAEFDATLVCGRPEHGIVRLRCASCGHDEILAFSCKRRGFCPACGTRLHAPRAAGGAWRRVPRIWWSGSFPPYRCASSC
jgi:ribosomal protein S27E